MLYGCLSVYIFVILFLTALASLLSTRVCGFSLFSFSCFVVERTGTFYVEGCWRVYDLEGSNNVDPLVSRSGQIYLMGKYI